MPPGPAPPRQLPSGNRCKGRTVGEVCLFPRDDVKKTSRHFAAPASCRLLDPPMRIPDEGERRVALALRLDRGIVKLMPTQQGAFRAQGMRLDKARLPVAEMELGFRKAERRPEKSRHGMDMADLIGQALPQNHVTAAFAMRGPSFHEPAQTVEKALRCREPSRVKLGIAAWQPAEIAMVRRRLIGERRKESDFRARLSPARQNMRIEKRERFVPGDRDALRGRRQGGRSRARRCLGRAGTRQNGAGIGMFLDKPRDPVQSRIETGGFARLHEAEMTFRQIDFFVAGQGPQNRYSERLDGFAREAAMTRASHPV